jgi:glycosyltransferase involved in cell wall biosynthesis
MRNLTIVVCTKNSEKLLEDCLKTIKDSAPESELVIVDADSVDQTLKIARKYTDKIISDHKKGLSFARQLGIDKASNDFVAFIGPDNLVPQKALNDLMAAIEKNERVAGVQPLTIIKEPQNYWERSTKYIFEFLLNTVGPIDVMGTPCIFRKKIISALKYDEAITGGCDDTDLSLRIKKAGFELKRVNTMVYEKQDLDFKKFFLRWKFYGKGDAQFYRKYSKVWTVKRKLKSILHPFRKYILKGFSVSIGKRKPILIPALIVAAFARYYGWASEAIAGTTLFKTTRPRN